MPKRFDIAIVFYEEEILLLRLLVASIEKFVDPNIINNIYVINNSANMSTGFLIYNQIVAPLVNVYEGRVQLISKEVLGLGRDPDISSYTMQQALKLHISSLISSDEYLLLDAKNHFIRPVKIEDFFDDSGKIYTEETKQSGYLLTCLQQSLKFLNTTTPDEMHSLPTVTPYMMKTQIVRSMLGDFRKMFNKNAAQVISENNKRTEFFMYYAYMLKISGGWKQFYQASRRKYVTLFTRYPEGQDLTTSVIARVSNSDVYCFAIHKKRFDTLSKADENQIIEMWENRGLLTRSEAVNLLSDQRRINRGDNIHDVIGGMRPQLTGDMKVTQAKNGRLFIDNDSNGVAATHLGTAPLSADALGAWLDLLQERKNFCARSGIVYKFLVAPDSHAVYENISASLTKSSENRPVIQMRDNIATPDVLIYPLAAMQEARDSGEPIHPTDSHWSSFGAYVAYKEAMSQIPSIGRALTDADVIFSTAYNHGDLGDKFEPNLLGVTTEVTIKKSVSKRIWNNRISNRGRMDFWVNSDSTLPSGLLITDSYGWKIQQFFAQSFSWLFVLHSPYSEFSAIEAFKPDIVIQLMAERFLNKVPIENPSQTALQFSASKGANSEYPDIARLIAPHRNTGER